MASLRLLACSGLAAALIAVGLTGCRPHETPVEAGYRTQTLLLGNLGEPNDLDPAYPDTVETEQIIMGLMEGLAQYDVRTCEPVPAVAERWEVSSDNLVWTFHLRPEARWSNGDPVVAGDFVYAYRRILSPKLAAEYAQMLFALKNGEAFYAGKLADFSTVGAHAADPHTLVLTLAHPVPYLPKLVCHSAWYPVHAATIEKFGRIDQRGTHWTRPGNYVGNGPFVLAEWRPNQFIRLTKSPTYWARDTIRLHKVVFYPIEDVVAEEAMFRNGQLHMTDTIPSNRIAVYRRDPKLAGLLHQEPQLTNYYYRFNVAKAPLNDVRVRRALAYSINRQDIVDHVTQGSQPVANHFTPTMSGFSSTAVVPYDPEQARQLLAQAGYPGGRGFPHLEILFNSNAGHREIAEAIQQMWRKELGISVGLYNQEAKVWIDSMRQGNYQIARCAWSGDYLDPSTFLEIMSGDDGNNQTGWKNAEYDRLIAEARRTPNDRERFALFQRCEQILAEECPVAPIYFYTRNNLRRPQLKGWYPNALNLHAFNGVYLEAN